MTNEEYKIFKSKMTGFEEIPIELLVQEIEPYERDSIDLLTLYNQELLRRALNVMKRDKDENKVRNWLGNGTGKLINVPKTQSMTELNKVEKQLKKKSIGLNASLDKVQRRKQVLYDQISIFEEES